MNTSSTSSFPASRDSKPGLCAGAALALIVALAASPARAETLVAHSDTFVGPGDLWSNGSSQFLRVEMNTGTGVPVRSSVISFYRPVSDNVNTARLMFDVTQVGQDTGIYVWGVLDQTPYEDVDETAATWYHYIDLLDDSGDGTLNSLTNLYDGNPALSGAQPLGVLSVTTSDVGGTVFFENDNLVDFINADTNGIVTIILTRAVDGDFRTRLASKDHATRSGPRLFIKGEDTLTPAADTFVRSGETASKGAFDTLRVGTVNDFADDATKHAAIEFTMKSDEPVRDATLYLDVERIYNATSTPETLDLVLWGVEDDLLADFLGLDNPENFGEQSANYEYFRFKGLPGLKTGVFDNSGDGVKNSRVQRLATFQVSDADVGQTIGISSEELVHFINTNANNKVTFVITSESVFNARVEAWFASKEHTILSGPRMDVRYKLDSWALPEPELAYMDVDHDGTDDLVLDIKNPDGSGYLVYEPFTIAEYAYHAGYGLGGDTTYFYDSLSPLQKSALSKTIDCLGVYTPGGPMTGTYIQSGLDSLPEGREYPVAHYDAGASASPAHGVSVYFEVSTCTIAEYAVGDLSVAVEGPSAGAAMTVTDESMAFGYDQSLVTVTATYGNENGSYISLSASAGEGFWYEVRYGQNGQYGFTADMPYIPVSLSIYVRGKDAVHVYNDLRDWVVNASGSSYVWAKSYCHQAIDWGQENALTMVDQMDRVGLQVVASAGQAVIWVDDAGERALVTLEGSANTVANELTAAVDMTVTNLANTSVNAATAISSWASSTSSTVTAAYDTVSGWVVGSADDLATFAESAGDDLLNVAQDIGDGVESTADQLGDAIENGLKSLF